MKEVAEVLYDYLYNVIYNPAKATIDIDKLPEEFKEFGVGLHFFCECVMEASKMALALSRGFLDIPVPTPDNELASPLKSLHASLKHLAWQTQQVANGDYLQRVAFMGEFAEAFNQMVDQLSERQSKLENEIQVTQKKSKSLLQSNLLFSSLIHYVPQRIFVIDITTQDIVLMNDAAINEINQDSEYLIKINYLRNETVEDDNFNEIIINYHNNETAQKLQLKSYILEWKDTNVEVLLITDYKVEVKIEKPEITSNLPINNNRVQSIGVLKKWLDQGKSFSLLIINLDSIMMLKKLEGIEIKKHILSVRNDNKFFPTDTFCSFLRPNELILLAPDIDYLTAQLLISTFFKDIGLQEKLHFGIVTIDKNNLLSLSDILTIADTRLRTKIFAGK